MNVIIRIALMFFVIQFLVVFGVMVVALWLAPPELPELDQESKQEILVRNFAAVIALLPRIFRSAAYWVRLVYRKLGRSLHHA